MPCRKACPRMVCKGRNHPRPPCQPTHQASWWYPPWGSSHPCCSRCSPTRPNHGAVLVLVIELAELDKVVVVTNDLRLLQSLLDKADDLVKLAELLASIVSLAELDADLLDDVDAKGKEDVHEVVHVNFTLHVPIVDLADLSDIISRSRHGDLICL